MCSRVGPLEFSSRTAGGECWTPSTRPRSVAARKAAGHQSTDFANCSYLDAFDLVIESRGSTRESFRYRDELFSFFSVIPVCSRAAIELMR